MHGQKLVNILAEPKHLANRWRTLQTCRWDIWL